MIKPAGVSSVWDTGRVGSTALCQRGNGDAAGEEMKMKDTNLEGARHKKHHGSAGVAIPHLPRVSALPSLMEGSGSSAALCPSPQAPVPAVLLSQALTHLTVEPGTGSAVLCPGTPAETWGRTQLRRLSGCSCHSRIWGREKQQVLAAPRYHQPSRVASKTGSFSFPTLLPLRRMGPGASRAVLTLQRHFEKLPGI